MDSKRELEVSYLHSVNNIRIPLRAMRNAFPRYSLFTESQTTRMIDNFITRKSNFQDCRLRCRPLSSTHKSYLSSQTRNSKRLCLFPRVHASEIGGMGSEISLNNDNMYRIQEGETGWERLKMMYTLQENFSIGPEIEFVVLATYRSFFVGVAIGALYSYQDSLTDFIRQNQDQKFMNQMDARRKLQDRVFITMCKTGMKWGWRLALFTGIYMLVTISATVYDNDVKIFHHAIAGATAGTLWKTKMGLKAMAVGGGVGGALGCVAGAIFRAAMWLTGVSVHELRYWHHGYWELEFKQRQEELRQKKQSKLDHDTKPSEDKKIDPS